VVIDTAGVRRAKSHRDAVDFYSDARSFKAIRRADVVLLLFDASERLSVLEKKLARYVAEHYKPVILGANKWDKAGDLEPTDFESYLQQELPGLQRAPVSFLSGLTGQGAWETIALAGELAKASRRRVSTGELNRIISAATEARSPSRLGHRVRIRYATQTSVSPPTFVVFVNDRRLVGKDYIRYLENRLRDELGFDEIPLHIVLRDKESFTPSEA